MKTLTDREIAEIRGKLSRIIRQTRLIDQGNERTKDGVSRMDIILTNAMDIDNDFLKA